MCAAEADRRLVYDQLAAALGEDGWTTDKAFTALLADAGGRTFDAHTVRSGDTQDRVVPASPMVPAVESWTSPFTPPVIFLA